MGSDLPDELFLGIPAHVALRVVGGSRLAVDGWVLVNKQTLETRFPTVKVVGNVNRVGTPKAGGFAEGAARVVAADPGARDPNAAIVCVTCRRQDPPAARGLRQARAWFLGNARHREATADPITTDRSTGAQVRERVGCDLVERAHGGESPPRGCVNRLSGFR